ARMIIKGQALAEEASRRRLSAALAEHGIDPNRLDIRPREPSYQGHLAAYGDVDIALDTFPYNGTTTTCEALAMGVPVVALAGSVHAARVGVSVLTHAGMGQWITATQDEFVRAAVELSRDPSHLVENRSSMRAQ